MRIIAGIAGSRRIEAPKGQGTRPTLDRVRENLFNMLQGELTNALVLDVFAGSGALGLEALSRGAAEAVFSDRDPEAVRTVGRNIRSLGFEDRSRVIPGDWRGVLKILIKDGAGFDIVFLDPPYGMKDVGELLSDLLPLLRSDALVVVEHEAKAAPDVCPGYDLQRRRSWGYCGVSIFRRKVCEQT